MGSRVSGMMADEESYSSSASDDTDSDTNYAAIFQRLINRYTNTRYTPTPTDESSELIGTPPPKVNLNPNTTKLQETEFYATTKLDSGLGLYDQKIENNITIKLMERERGKRGHENFSKSSRCRISTTYLPNEMEKLDSYDGKVFCGMYSDDGSYFITASQDQLIRLYKTENGYELLRAIHARDVGWSIIDVAFSPNKEHFVYSTWSTALHLCPISGDPNKQEPLCLVSTARRFCVFSLAFSSDGHEILGGANDGILCIYDLQRNMRTLKIPAHEFDVNTVAFADESSHVMYSGSDDGLIKVWDRRTLGDENLPTPVGVLAGHMDGITYINPKGDGRHLITNSKDQSIKLWDARVLSSESAAKNTLQAVHEQSWDYRWQGVPKRLYNNRDRLDGDTSIMTYRGHIITRTLIRCRFSPVETTGQRYIYTGCGGGRLIIYDALTGTVKKNEKKHVSCVRDVSWHPYNNEILTSSWDGTVGRWYYSHEAEKDSCSEKRKSEGSPRRSERIAQKKQREANPLNQETSDT